MYPARNTREILERLEAWGRSRQWVGADPYEGLNTPLARVAPGRRGRQAVTQAYKRLPFAPPWPLRSAPRRNAKALALALGGYATPAGRKLPGAERYLRELPQQLGALNLLADGAAWGYPFDVQTRGVGYGATTPNAIATCFVVDALCDAEEAGVAGAGELALQARAFLLSLFQPDASAPYFSYVAAGAPLIHNANLLVCGALARLHGLEAQSGVEQPVAQAVQTTLAKTGPDGIWPYGETASYGWADNFHTAYTLEGLLRVGRAWGLGGKELQRGLAAWKSTFIDPDGWARYYPQSRYPLETHCAASAIDLLCLAGGAPEDRALAEAIARCAVAELWLEEEGCFAFRRASRGLNRRRFMRWTNAPMFRALARLCSRGVED